MIGLKKPIKRKCDKKVQLTVKLPQVIKNYLNKKIRATKSLTFLLPILFRRGQKHHKKVCGPNTIHIF